MALVLSETDHQSSAVRGLDQTAGSSAARASAAAMVASCSSGGWALEVSHAGGTYDPQIAPDGHFDYPFDYPFGYAQGMAQGMAQYKLDAAPDQGPGPPLGLPPHPGYVRCGLGWRFQQVKRAEPLGTIAGPLVSEGMIQDNSSLMGEAVLITTVKGCN